MSTKDRILRVLEENRGVFFSGEALAGRCGVSRTAVWKAVSALRAAGYPIEAVSNRGYALAPGSDILSAQGIEKYLPGLGLSLEVLPSAASTNALLRERAAAGAEEGCVLLSGTQTAGRGRMGRSFFSPPDTGIYMSLLLRPRNLAPNEAVSLTTMAAAAMCLAIEAVSGRNAGIKWVNDIFLEGKKVCGILTEAALSLEADGLDYVVLGVGINAYAPPEGFPPELAGIAGAVFESPVQDGKNRLAAAFLEKFFGFYRGEAPESWAEIYRERSLVLGREVTVLGRGAEKTARALEIDGSCRLVVEYPDGSREALSSGEIHVRL